ncbi:MAG: GTP 3',8-cyclase MoaA [Acidimicrobiia bacterium]|nr:GTP 3',8-cyclase MoaA [Acidimicrobiia bacterium]
METGCLIDRFGRIHTDLRISVTDRCDMRCRYCMPEEGLTWSPRGDILTFEEITRFVRVLVELGLETIRLTGGEPLVRHDLPALIGNLRAAGISELAMTTNGATLHQHASALRSAGLDRLNVSCDSLRRERFAEMTRRDRLPQVLAGMDAAEAAGFPPVKVNVVLIRGWNDDEILDFADFAYRTGRTVRFIEFMPVDADELWRFDEVVSGDDVIRTVSERYDLDVIDRTHAPAQSYSLAGSTGRIGVITSMTDQFCGSCNRLRLTADGQLRNCLFGNDEYSVRDALRSGATDSELADLAIACVQAKKAHHGTDEVTISRPTRSMSQQGG